MPTTRRQSLKDRDFQHQALSPATRSRTRKSGDPPSKPGNVDQRAVGPESDKARHMDHQADIKLSSQPSDEPKDPQSTEAGDKTASSRQDSGHAPEATPTEKTTAVDDPRGSTGDGKGTGASPPPCKNPGANKAETSENNSNDASGHKMASEGQPAAGEPTNSRAMSLTTTTDGFSPRPLVGINPVCIRMYRYSPCFNLAGSRGMVPPHKQRYLSQADTRERQESQENFNKMNRGPKTQAVDGLVPQPVEDGQTQTVAPKTPEVDWDQEMAALLELSDIVNTEEDMSKLRTRFLRIPPTVKGYDEMAAVFGYRKDTPNPELVKEWERIQEGARRVTRHGMEWLELRQRFKKIAPWIAGEAYNQLFEFFDLGVQSDDPVQLMVAGATDTSDAATWQKALNNIEELALLIDTDEGWRDLREAFIKIPLSVVDMDDYAHVKMLLGFPSNETVYLREDAITSYDKSDWKGELRAIELLSRFKTHELGQLQLIKRLERIDVRLVDVDEYKRVRAMVFSVPQDKPKTRTEMQAAQRAGMNCGEEMSAIRKAKPEEDADRQPSQTAEMDWNRELLWIKRVEPTVFRDDDRFPLRKRFVMIPPTAVDAEEYARVKSALGYSAGEAIFMPTTGNAETYWDKELAEIESRAPQTQQYSLSWVDLRKRLSKIPRSVRGFDHVKSLLGISSSDRVFYPTADDTQNMVTSSSTTDPKKTVAFVPSTDIDNGDAELEMARIMSLIDFTPKGGSEWAQLQQDFLERVPLGVAGYDDLRIQLGISEKRTVDIPADTQEKPEEIARVTSRFDALTRPKGIPGVRSTTPTESHASHDAPGVTGAEEKRSPTPEAAEFDPEIMAEFDPELMAFVDLMSRTPTSDYETWNLIKMKFKEVLPSKKGYDNLKELLGFGPNEQVYEPKGKTDVPAAESQIQPTEEQAMQMAAETLVKMNPVASTSPSMVGGATGTTQAPQTPPQTPVVGMDEQMALNEINEISELLPFVPSWDKEGREALQVRLRKIPVTTEGYQALRIQLGLPTTELDREAHKNLTSPRERKVHGPGGVAKRPGEVTPEISPKIGGTAPTPDPSASAGRPEKTEGTKGTATKRKVSSDRTQSSDDEEHPPTRFKLSTNKGYQAPLPLFPSPTSPNVQSLTRSHVEPPRQEDQPKQSVSDAQPAAPGPEKPSQPKGPPQ